PAFARIPSGPQRSRLDPERRDDDGFHASGVPPVRQSLPGLRYLARRLRMIRQRVRLLQVVPVPLLQRDGALLADGPAAVPASGLSAPGDHPAVRRFYLAGQIAGLRVEPGWPRWPRPFPTRRSLPSPRVP